MKRKKPLRYASSTAKTRWSYRYGGIVLGLLLVVLCTCFSTIGSYSGIDGAGQIMNLDDVSTLIHELDDPELLATFKAYEAKIRSAAN